MICQKGSSNLDPQVKGVDAPLLNFKAGEGGGGARYKLRVLFHFRFPDSPFGLFLMAVDEIKDGTIL